MYPALKAWLTPSRIILITVLLLLGATTSVAVAWGCMLHSSAGHPRYAQDYFAFGDYPFGRAANATQTLLEFYPAVDWSLGRNPERTPDAWSRASTLREHDRQTIVERAVGWPMRCVSGAVVYSEEEDFLIAPVVQGQSGLFMGLRSQAVKQVFIGPPIVELPYRVLPIGLATNALVFGLAWSIPIGISRAFRYTRDRWRRRKGVCPQCRHRCDPGRAAQRCPECGHRQRKSSSGSLAPWILGTGTLLLVLNAGLVALAVNVQCIPFDTELHRAVRAGDDSNVRGLLATGVSVNERIIYGDGYSLITPLLSALIHGHESTARILMNASPTVGPDNSGHNGALLNAAIAGQCDSLVNEWLDLGFNPTADPASEFTPRGLNSEPLVVAIVLGTVPITARLIDAQSSDGWRGVDDGRKHFLLYMSSMSAMPEVMRFLEGETIGQHTLNEEISEDELSDMLQWALHGVVGGFYPANARARALRLLKRGVEIPHEPKSESLRRSEFGSVLPGLTSDIELLRTAVESGFEPSETTDYIVEWWFTAPSGQGSPQTEAAAREVWEYMIAVGLNPNLKDHSGRRALDVLTEPSPKRDFLLDYLQDAELDSDN